MDLLTTPVESLVAYSDDQLVELAHQLLEVQTQDRQRNQLRYYRPVNPTAAGVHASHAHTIGIGGGNGSSKTDTALVELVIRATGQIPHSLRDSYPRDKLRGPIQARVVCESLTTTLVPIILPKLQWWQWSGVSQFGGDKGHWGWIPQHCLLGGEWAKSWNERVRLLRVLYRDPEKPERVVGHSSIQFMSYDQDPSDFASGDLHFILHDEPPRWDIWRENRARVMRVNGTMLLAMTWPDDPTIPVDWILDEVYERAQAHTPGVEWITLFTTDNPHLNQDAVAAHAKLMSTTERQARIYGQPIRLSNRVHPLFTDTPRDWCFTCRDAVIRNEAGLCGNCGNTTLSFQHTEAVVGSGQYPVIYAIDPHPRKPHYMLWVQVDPNDDLAQVAERTVDGSPEEVEAVVAQVERDYGWRYVTRLIDPNMGRSPSDTRRELTWQEAFELVGLRCDLADDSAVGRRTLDNYLEPDRKTERPRFVVDPACTETIYQLKRYLWDDYRRGSEHDLKQRPKDKHSDYPTLLKYIMNMGPSFRGLRSCGRVFSREGQRAVVGY